MKTKRKGISLLEVLALIVFVSFVWGLSIFPTQGSREAARRAKCALNLSEIGKAAAKYKTATSNSIPSLQSLTNYVNSLKIFTCPSARHAPGFVPDSSQWTDYLLVSGIHTASISQTIICFCPPRNHGGKGCNVLNADGTVEWIDYEEFLKRFVKGQESK